jgi:hypothetical protein
MTLVVDDREAGDQPGAQIAPADMRLDIRIPKLGIVPGAQDFKIGT